MKFKLKIFHIIFFPLPFIIAYFLLVSFFPTKSFKYEKDYQEVLSNYFQAEKEKIIEYGLRPDMIKDKEVFEIDFINKFYEGLGQVLIYAYITQKQPVLVLILDNIKLLYKLDLYISYCKYAGIKLYTIDKKLNIKEYLNE